MLKFLLPAVWGLLGGAAEYLLLRLVVSSVASRGKINPLYVAAFSLLPLALLLPVAFLDPDRILLCGSCAAGVLIFSAVIQFLRNRNKSV